MPVWRESRAYEVGGMEEAMILDTLKNLDNYKTLGKEDRYAKAIDFLKHTDLANLEPGKYEIDGRHVYANVVSYTTIPWEEGKFEAHRDYTDIQYVIEGSEIMGYAPIDELTESVSYNPDKDVVFYDNSVHGLDVPVKAGQYAIFQPQDGHKPKVANGSASGVKKVIVKILEK